MALQGSVRPALLGQVMRSRPARSGTERANRFVLTLILLQRLSYIAPPVVSHAQDAYRNPALNLVLLGVTVAWNVVLFWRATRRGWFEPWAVWVDVALAGALLLVVTSNIAGPEPFGWSNWSTRTGMAATALAAVALDPLPVAAAGVGVVLAVNAGLTVALFGDSARLVVELAGRTNGPLWFAIIGGFAVRYLRRQGRRLDELAAERLAAESSRAAEHARHQARLAHYQALHDTVLTTLTAIARGGLDHRAEQVRQRCARDADYIRRLLREGVEGARTDLGAKLAETIEDAELLGLRIHYLPDTLPKELPGEVVEALGNASQEALGNVFKHAGTGEAWVTVTEVDGTLTLRVVDRGQGFDPGATPFGFGLTHSVVERLRAAGGQARVSSTAGSGTCVELTWPS